MKNKELPTKILAITGVLLVWLPLLAPVVFSVFFYLRSHLLRFDYLIPAELFPVGLLGGVLLLWATRRAAVRMRLISWGLAVAVISLVLGQALAVLTGLASGEMEPAGPWFVVLVSTLVLFWAGMLATAIGGAVLLKHVLQPPALPAEGSQSS